MAIHDPVPLALLLSQTWWRRLQEVAQACSTSPGEFVREVLEAEIVRRELLMEHDAEPTVSWLGDSNAPSTTQLQ